MKCFAAELKPVCSVFQFYFPKQTVVECREISLKLTQIAEKYRCRSNSRTREIFAYYRRTLSPELLSESESEVSSSFSRVLKYESAKLFLGKNCARGLEYGPTKAGE